jgi:hypothetical protein
VKEYDIYVPLRYNDGTPVEPRELQTLKQLLVDHFGGLTFFPQPNEGFWTAGGITYRDEIVIYRVVTDKTRGAKRFLTTLKERLKRSLEQEEILITVRDVDVL